MRNRHPVFQTLDGGGIAAIDPEVMALRAVSALLAHFGESLPSCSTVGVSMRAWSHELAAAAEERLPAQEGHASALRPV